MLSKTIYSCFFFLCISTLLSAQEKTNLIIKKDSVKKSRAILNQGIDPLSPSRAAFYSAVLPGLGQAYNKKWWKVPIVWGAIGTGVYFYDRNDKDFKRYQRAYRASIAGRPHEFDGSGESPPLSDDALIRAQEVFKKNRDLSLFISIGLYALNILEANVDAHLPDNALDTNLSMRPSVFMTPIDNRVVAGFTLTYDF